MYLPLVCILAGVWIGMAVKVVVVAWEDGRAEAESLQRILDEMRKGKI